MDKEGAEKRLGQKEGQREKAVNDRLSPKGKRLLLLGVAGAASCSEGSNSTAITHNQPTEGSQLVAVAPLNIEETATDQWEVH